MGKFLHAVNSVKGCNWTILEILWKAFHNWSYVWQKAELEDLMKAGCGEKFAGRLVDLRTRFDVEKEFSRLWDKDIVVVSRNDREYPEPLLRIPDAPFLLYRKGAALTDHKRMMAIVGTRNSTKYGEGVAYNLAEALALQNVTVVSGLAFGIDAVSHFGCVSSKKPTIAVLASGLFDITPSTHQRLSEKILEYGGSLISEYPPSDAAYPSRFLERNRIIAGLSEVTVVIEAGERSGALVTARLAADYNRDVYALPADIHRAQAQGCLKLLYNGAAPFIGVQNFLEDRKLHVKTVEHVLNSNEMDIVDSFCGEARTTDELAEKTLFTIPTLTVLLTQLEFKGVIFRNSQRLWELKV